MDQRLIEVSQAGNIGALYELLREDSRILERVDEDPFIDTPFHIAVKARQTSFAMEIANLKPSFAKKLNQDENSPMHLASEIGNVGMVKELLTIGRELGLLKGRERRTPLHVAVMFGRIDVINELIKEFPNSFEELTVHKETLLHLALKYEQFDAFKQLLKLVRKLFKNSIVNWKDNEGNTVLHLAAARALPEIIKDLLRNSRVRVEVNAKNAKNQTALDVLLELPGDNGEIQDILRSAKAKRGDEIIPTSSERHNRVVSQILRHLRPLRAYLDFGEYLDHLIRHESLRDYSIEVRSPLLVVAVLIATVTFQAGLYPPGGVWQDTFIPANNNGTHNSTCSEKPHIAGQPILATICPLAFLVFMFFNWFGFLISCAMILNLTKGLPWDSLLRIALNLVCITYMFSLSCYLVMIQTDPFQRV